jgi:hypothetical protein
VLDADSDFDQYGYFYANPDVYGDTRCDLDINVNSDRNRNQHGNLYGNTDVHCNKFGDIYSHADADKHGNADFNIDAGLSGSSL